MELCTCELWRSSLTSLYIHAVLSDYLQFTYSILGSDDPILIINICSLFKLYIMTWALFSQGVVLCKQWRVTLKRFKVTTATDNSCFLFFFLDEYETENNLIRCHILRHLIWIYIICIGLCVQIFRVNTVCLFFSSKRQIRSASPQV